MKVSDNDAQEAKRLVLEKYPMAKCIPDWLSGRQHAIYLHRVASDEPVGSAWCNSTDEAWIDAATRLSPQPEIAQGDPPRAEARGEGE